MSVANATLRLLSALILGGVIGWEREVNSRAAGLRTHMLNSLASATFAIAAMELTSFEGDPDMAMRIDPRRPGGTGGSQIGTGAARAAETPIPSPLSRNPAFSSTRREAGLSVKTSALSGPMPAPSSQVAKPATTSEPSPPPATTGSSNYQIGAAGSPRPAIPTPTEPTTAPSRSITSRKGGVAVSSGNRAANSSASMPGRNRNSIRATSGRVAMA